MATTIKSTALDIDAIKNNLKTFLAEQDEFSDYNFEASGLSNILDVLAYNTHYNGLIANFALNESYLGTAQLRSSVVSLAEGIGYIPKSVTSAIAEVKLSLNLSGIAGRPSQIQINDGFKFNSSVDDTDYVFQTIEDLTATDDGAGVYEFKDALGSNIIGIKEGTSRTKTFLIGAANEENIYIIPDTTIDTSSAIVRVFQTPSSTTSATYTDIVDAVTINANSTLYILKEAPNGFYELSFGDGNTLGQVPQAGNKVVVSYLSSSGEDANLARTFEPQNQVSVNLVGYDLNVTTQSRSTGGSEKETLPSMRKNAPFRYSSQNRMVTAVDYSALALKNFSSLIKDIQAFGGQDALEPEFGTVFLSILFNDDVSASRILTTKTSIEDLADQLAVASFALKFDDPVKTFLETEIFFQFNPNLTTLSTNTIKDNVTTVVNNYFSTNTGRFNQSFRRSNLLTLIDDTSPAILSSRADVKMQRRFVPTLTAIQAHTIRYAAPIATPDDVDYRIKSSSFIFKNKVCIIRNKLNSNKLEVLNQSDRQIIIDNVGDYSGDTINIVGLQVDALQSGASFIKLSATPANQTAISPLRNDIVEHDDQISSVSIVQVEPGILN